MHAKFRGPGTAASKLKEKGPACAPHARPFQNGVRLARSARRTRSATAAGIADRIRVRQIREQLRLRAEHGRQRIVAADLVAPGRGRGSHAADADGAEELAV